MTTTLAQGTIQVRTSRDSDIPTITRIYAHWVRHGVASFELEPPSEATMRQRRQALFDGDYPYLVAENATSDAVLGFAYAGPYRTRPAYRFAVEDTVYVACEATRRGVGSALLAALLCACEQRDFRLVVAVIGDSGNTPSIELHARFGFTRAGLLPAVGWKHGRWVDSVLMTRTLGTGAGTPPDAEC